MYVLMPAGIVGTPSGGEILLVMLVILLLFGSKNLPRMARTIGRTLEEFRRAAREVGDEIMHAADDPPKPTGKLSGSVPRKPASPEPEPSGSGSDPEDNSPEDEEVYKDESTE